MSIIITLAFALLELFGGIISNSLALIGDSFHMLSDVLALGASAIAIYFSAKKPTDNFTFGYLRLEVITAFVNGLVLIAISFYMIIEGILSIIYPREIELKTMLGISIIVLIFNIRITLVLHKSLKEENNLNVQSAIWHFIGDLINSIGLIISAIIIYFTGYKIVDVIMSIFISFVLFKGGYKITKKAFLILMDYSNINIKDIGNDILNISGVDNVHESHLWNTNDEEKTITMHALINSNEINYRAANQKIKNILKDKYSI
ncbi:cation diffusion facilitator family transporter [Gemella sp. zg-1178]|uniref:cation diffusion facilitator family transporter n=1 Tax=Gemella sp. zg-1178 TaxID=2840372 RepID=UPI0035304C18